MSKPIFEQKLHAANKEKWVSVWSDCIKNSQYALTFSVSFSFSNTFPTMFQIFLDTFSSLFSLKNNFKTFYNEFLPKAKTDEKNTHNLKFLFFYSWEIVKLIMTHN